MERDKDRRWGSAMANNLKRTERQDEEEDKNKYRK